MNRRYQEIPSLPGILRLSPRAFCSCPFKIIPDGHPFSGPQKIYYATMSPFSFESSELRDSHSTFACHQWLLGEIEINPQGGLALLRKVSKLLLFTGWHMYWLFEPEKAKPLGPVAQGFVSLFGNGWQLAIPSSVLHPGHVMCLWISCCITLVYIMVAFCDIRRLIHVDSPAAQMSMWFGQGRKQGIFHLLFHLRNENLHLHPLAKFEYGKIHCSAELCWQSLLFSSSRDCLRSVIAGTWWAWAVLPACPGLQVDYPLYFLLAHWESSLRIFLPLPFFSASLKGF